MFSHLHAVSVGPVATRMDEVLVHPRDHVALPPRDYKLKPPTIPARKPLELKVLVNLSRQLEYAEGVREQRGMRALFAKHIPGFVAPHVKVPCHVFGGYPSWEQAIYAVLHFYSIGSNEQLHLIKQASHNQSHCKFYRNNIVRLQNNRPSPLYLLAHATTNCKGGRLGEGRRGFAAARRGRWDGHVGGQIS